ncbi:hypothetical protein JCM11491_006791 [Sporobolomyces phaffii]
MAPDELAHVFSDLGVGSGSSDCSRSESFHLARQVHREAWITLAVSPALSPAGAAPVSPGEPIALTFDVVEGVHLVELRVRLVGSSLVAHKHRHEFVSVPYEFDPSVLLDSVDNSPLSVRLAVPHYHSCDCAGRRGPGSTGPLSLIPLPPSYEFHGNRIEYALEVTGAFEKKEDRKGKAKWRLFGDKPTRERFEIPFEVNTDSQYDPSWPSPPPLAREQTYRTYPVSREAVNGNRHVTRVDLQEPREIGLVARIKSAELVVELTTSPDPSRSAPSLVPSFKYTLFASLGHHAASSLPLLSASLALASAYAHLVLHKSTTLDYPAHRRQTSKRVALLTPQGGERANEDKHGEDDERARNMGPLPFERGTVHESQPGFIDDAYELVYRDDDDDETGRGRVDLDGEATRPVWVKFERHVRVDVPGLVDGGREDASDERRLVPIRTCALEVRYDLVATFQFGPDHASGVMLASTNLPLHVEASTLVPDRRERPCDPPSSSAIRPLASTSSSRVARQSAEALPAYDAEMAPAASSVDRNEKRPRSDPTLTAGDGPGRVDPSSVAPPPPAYRVPTRGLDPSVPEAIDTGRQGGASRVDVEAGEAPPSWEETVRDDMVDDWLAASVALGVVDADDGHETRQ